MTRATAQKETTPVEAFRFGATAFEFAEAPAEGAGPRKIKGVAYSGDMLAHPYWGGVIFDLSTCEAPGRMPVLVDHDRSKRAGVAQLSIGDRIDLSDGFLLPNDVGASVAADADAGFPWQLSVHIEPREIQILSAGESAEVNGRKVDGPATVFRHSLIREVSLTPTGVDSNTTAAVFSVGATQREVPTMTPTTETTTTTDPAAAAAAAETARVAAQASADAATAELATVRAERDAARTELETIRKNTRMSAVVALFAETGRTFADDAARDTAAAPYLGLDETAFAAVAADLRAAKPKAPAGLFSHQATTGAGNGATADVNDPHQFAAAIQREQAKAAREGEQITVLEAANRVRAAAAN